MEYLIAYLLLTLTIDLIRELFSPDASRRNGIVLRRLWNDTSLDCCTRVDGVEDAAMLRSAPSPFHQPRKPKKRYRSWFVSPWKAQKFVKR